LCSALTPCTTHEECPTGFRCAFSCCSLGTSTAYCTPRCGLSASPSVAAADVLYLTRQRRGLTTAG
jgi:hypothetical protein